MQYEQHSPLDSHSDLEALLKLRVSEGKENDQEHQRKIDAVRDLYYSLERPGDTAHRLIFQVGAPQAPYVKTAYSHRAVIPAVVCSDWL